MSHIDAWDCSCGSRNPIALEECPNCGKQAFDGCPVICPACPLYLALNGKKPFQIREITWLRQKPEIITITMMNGQSHQFGFQASYWLSSGQDDHKLLGLMGYPVRPERGMQG